MWFSSLGIGSIAFAIMQFGLCDILVDYGYK